MSFCLVGGRGAEGSAAAWLSVRVTQPLVQQQQQQQRRRRQQQLPRQLQRPQQQLQQRRPRALSDPRGMPSGEDDGDSAAGAAAASAGAAAAAARADDTTGALSVAIFVYRPWESEYYHFAPFEVWVGDSFGEAKLRCVIPQGGGVSEPSHGGVPTVALRATHRAHTPLSQCILLCIPCTALCIQVNSVHSRNSYYTTHAVACVVRPRSPSAPAAACACTPTAARARPRAPRPT